MVKVSVIIPVYNGVKFIDKCVDCLKNQTYKNLELIFLNDGSTDKSLSMLNKYEKNTENMFVYSHSNVGLSITRNIGISKATGDYITVLDVDDYFDYDFIEIMVKEIENFDILIAGYRRIFEDGSLDFEYSLENTNWNKFKRVTVWAKLYKRSFLEKNDIKYPNIRIYGEDVVYTMKCMSKFPNVKIIQYIGYNNLINENSLTHASKNKIINDVPKMINEIYEFIKENSTFLSSEHKNIKFYFLKIFSNYLFELSEFVNIEDINMYYEININTIKMIFKEFKYDFSFIWMKSEDLKVNLFLNFVILFDKLRLEKLYIKLLHKKFYLK